MQNRAGCGVRVVGGHGRKVIGGRGVWVKSKSFTRLPRMETR
jgi:hypothetical protein